MSNFSDDDLETAIDAALAGTPDAVVRAMTTPSIVRASDEVREALAHFALALPPVEPSADLRAQVQAKIAGRPRADVKRAVLVVDMIEDYLTPGRPLFVPRAPAVVPAIARRLDDARRDGTPVVYLCDHHEADDPDLDALPLHGVEGTTGWQTIHALEPARGDTVIKHRTLSAFHGTDLGATLARMNVNTLVLTGCATDVSILATAFDALMRGYAVEVPPETQAGSSEAAETVAINVLAALRPVSPMPAP